MSLLDPGDPLETLNEPRDESKGLSKGSNGKNATENGLTRPDLPFLLPTDALNGSNNTRRLMRTRVTDFCKSHPSTAAAAEFLDLATKKRLNILSQRGYDLDSINTILEKKFLLKKRFWNSTVVTHHPFKRMNFAKFVAIINDPESITVNTTFTEDQLAENLSKSQLKELKRLNNIALNEFLEMDVPEYDQQVSASRNEETQQIKDSQFVKSTVRELPEDNSDQDDDSQIKRRKIHHRRTLRNLNHLSSDPDLNVFDEESFIQNTTINEHVNGEHKPANEPLDNSIFEEGRAILDTSSDAQHQELVKNQNNDTPDKKPLDRRPDIDNAFPDADAFELTPDPFDNQIKSFLDEISHCENPDDPYAPRKRSLRHSDISKRKPYMVDYAVSLALATKFSIIEMESSGKTDDEIENALNEIYQQKRLKWKGEGRSPYLKETFQENMKFYMTSSSMYKSHNVADDADVEIEDGQQETQSDSGESAFETQISDLDTQEILQNVATTDIIETETKRFHGSKKLMPSDYDNENGNIDYDTDDFNDIFSDFDDEIHEVIVNDSNYEDTAPADKTSGMKRSRSYSPHLVDFAERAAIDPMLSKPASKPSKKHDAVNNGFIDRYFSKAKKTAYDHSKEETESKLDSFSSYGPEVNKKTADWTRNRNLDLMDDGYGESEQLRSEMHSVTQPNRRIRLNKPISKLTKAKSELGNKPLSNEQTLRLNKTLHKSLNDMTPIASHSDNNTVNKKKSVNSTIVAASYVPKTNSDFSFKRAAVQGSYQNETVVHAQIKNSKPPVATRASEIIKVQPTRQFKNDRLNWLFSLKPQDFIPYARASKLLDSELINNILHLDSNYYTRSDILFNLANQVIMISPQNDSVHSIVESLSEIFGYIKLDLKADMNLKKVKLIRALFIKLITLCWSLEKFKGETIVDFSLMLKDFLNGFKSDPIKPESCVLFFPYAMVCMILCQRFLGYSYHRYPENQKVISWVEKVIVVKAFTLSDEIFSLDYKMAILDSIKLFMKFSQSCWSLIVKPDLNIDPANVTLALYFLSEVQEISPDWSYYIRQLKFFENMQYDDISDQKSQLKIRNLCALIAKVNKDLKWELDSEILIKTFRLLSSHQFVNLGSSKRSEASVYITKVPENTTIMSDDGCLNIYFKLLSIFFKSRLEDASCTGYQISNLSNDLIPSSSLDGYSELGLKNRAMVTLVAADIFDMDLSYLLENIIDAMLNLKTAYSFKSALGLVGILVNGSSRKPGLIILKFLSSIVNTMNSFHYADSKIKYQFNEFLQNVETNITYNSDISMKYLLQCFLNLLKIKSCDDISYTDKLFNEIKTSWDFRFNELGSEKVKSKKILLKITKLTYNMLIDNTYNIKLKPEILKYYVFANMKANITVEDIYQKWINLYRISRSDSLELHFFNQLLDFPSVTESKTIVELTKKCYFKHLPENRPLFLNFLRKLVLMGLIPENLKQYSNMQFLEFNTHRVEFSIKSLGALVPKYRTDASCRELIITFIKSLYVVIGHETDREYLKEVASYLYITLGDDFILDEWTSLKGSLRVETYTWPITKLEKIANHIEYNKLAVLITNLYIAAVIDNKLNDFKDDFVKLVTKNNSLRISNIICNIIQYHIGEIQLSFSGNEHHVTHIFYWIQMLDMIASLSHLLIDYSSVLTTCRLSGLLKNKFHERKFDLFYYYHSVCLIYQILLRFIQQLRGFSEFNLIKHNFDEYSSMDLSNNSLISETDDFFNHSELKPKLDIVFDVYHSRLQNSYHAVSDPRDIYEMENQILRKRDDCLYFLEHL